MTQVATAPEADSLLTVIVLNYNGRQWLERCLSSLRSQTIPKRLEIIFVDNRSSDDSVAVARTLLAGLPNARVVENEGNLGFCEGNNRGAASATGKYLLFLNSDTWSEPDAMEKLLAEVESWSADVATPLVLNYGDDTFQDIGFFGFDVFGLPSGSTPVAESREIFIAGGCALLIRREVFEEVGGFDPEYFMYSDDVDLCWRAQVAGATIMAAISSRIHHRGAVAVNPAGGAATTEFRTADTKRFFSNRNTLLTLLKGCQHVLLVLVPIQIAFLFLESLVVCVLLKRGSYFRIAFVNALRDCWRLRKHVIAERGKIARFRRRSDFALMRFFRLRLNRWFEIRRLFRFGVPRVDAR